MKNPTIWESASRPLFVRTVWLEASQLRRGLQRHFLLDYDINRPLESFNYLIKPLQKKRTEILKRCVSLELNNFTDFDYYNADENAEVFLIGSAKVKLHEPFKFATNKTSKLLTCPRRPSISKRKHSIYNNYHFTTAKHNISRRSSDISDLYSRKNSLTQTPTPTTETADELLAQRVLHWLDLARKENFLKNLNSLKGMEVKLSKTTKLRQDAIKRYNNKAAQNTPSSRDNKTKSCQRSATTTAAQSPAQRKPSASEAVKHITIIFNREGQPIRLNRPAKNIDLCALSTSPNTARRLAGPLASASLYKSAEDHKTPPYGKSKTGTENNKWKSLSSLRRLDTVSDLANSNLQKRLHETPKQGNYNNNLHDSKKQLHIFMPTLLKKGLTKSLYGTEDDISELSHNFSELCRI